MSFVLVNIWKDYNPISITICYYSIWGTLLALFSKLFSIIAIFKESWFRVAYITTELSYSTNLMITVVFWGVIWPFYSGHIEHRNNQDDLKQKRLLGYLNIYQALLHLIPFLSTCINLVITDMALFKGHWWHSVLLMFPLYTICNLWGSLNIGHKINEDKVHYGSIYGVESWDRHPFLTTIAFISLGFI